MLTQTAEGGQPPLMVQDIYTNQDWDSCTHMTWADPTFLQQRKMDL